MSQWISILQADFESLLAIEKQLPIAQLTNDQQRMHYYIQILKCYLHQDAGGIKKTMQDHGAWLNHNLDLLCLSEIQYLIRLRDFKSSDIEGLTNLAINHRAPLFLAEVSYVSATAFQMREDYIKSESLFSQAAVLFEETGVLKKSLHALVASIAAYSCLKPNSRLFAEHMLVYRKAIKIREHSVAAAALINISREFELLGGFTLALDYCDQAITLFKTQGEGSPDHNLGLIHQAQLQSRLKKSIA